MARPHHAFVMLAVLVMLLAACGSDNSTPTPLPTQPPTLVPLSTPTELPSATPPDAETPLPETTPEAEITAELTEEPLVQQIIVEAVEGQEIPPPISIVVPEGWAQLDSTVPLQDLGFGMMVLPFTVYYGPVTDGVGYIVVLWGFSSVAPGSLNSERYGQFNLGADGRRLLQLAVTDIGCVVGGITDPDYDREFPIGDKIGIGSYWSAVQCPESEDTRGWFAGVHYLGINYAFYAYTEPITAMDGSAEEELQAVLNTVKFLMTEPLATATPTG